MRPLKIGLDDKQRESSVKLLNVSLSNQMLLQIKTKKIHWDIVGPQFISIHKMLDTQYEELAEMVDASAERVRMLGGYPIGTAAGFLELAQIKEHPGKVRPATQSIEMLLNDHETMIRLLRDSVDELTDKVKDAGTADFLTGQMEKHEMTAWMLRSFIEGEAVKGDGEIRLPAAATPSMA